jgi:pimeloyl-ACP methyl ester carboxylesterase
VNEPLVRGWEDRCVGVAFATRTVPQLPGDAVTSSVDDVASTPMPCAAAARSRASDTIITQQAQRTRRRLRTPILANGGAASTGESVANTMKLAADDVQRQVIPGSGHFVAEEAPEAMRAGLTAFLAPYRDGAAAARCAARACVVLRAGRGSKPPCSWPRAAPTNRPP